MDKHRKAFKKGWKTIYKIGWHNREGQVSNSLSLPSVTVIQYDCADVNTSSMPRPACIWLSFKQVFRNHTGFPKDVLQIILFRVQSKTFYSAYIYIYRRSLSIDCWKSKQVLHFSSHILFSHTFAWQPNYCVLLSITLLNRKSISTLCGTERRTLMSLILRSFPWGHCSQGSCRMYFLIISVINLLLP